ncbi:MAG TPA: PAS domain-containing protein, partial [Stellaceae bacterium]|nr:PAS domain-containing protein [Stellaceae bacterium]
MTSELDNSLDWVAGFVTQIPAAVALFDAELRYVAASPEWIAAFGISRFPLAGNRHADLSAAGLLLDQVTQRALAGETVENCRIGGDDAAQPAVAGTVGARPYRDPNGMVAGVIVTLQVSRQDPTEV